MSQGAAITTNLLGRRAAITIPEPFPRAGEIGEVVALRHQGCNTFVMLLYPDGAAEEHTLQQIKFEAVETKAPPRDASELGVGRVFYLGIFGAIDSTNLDEDGLVCIITLDKDWPGKSRKPHPLSAAVDRRVVITRALDPTLGPVPWVCSSCSCPNAYARTSCGGCGAERP